MRYLLFSMFFFCGCQGGWQEATEVITDPNTVAAIGEAVGTVGLTIGRPELIGVSIIIGGVAVILRALKSKEK